MTGSWSFVNAKGGTHTFNDRACRIRSLWKKRNSIKGRLVAKHRRSNYDAYCLDPLMHHTHGLSVKMTYKNKFSFFDSWLSGATFPHVKMLLPSMHVNGFYKCTF